MFFELSLLIPLVFFLICSVSAESSLYCISRTLFRCSFFRPWVNQYMIHVLYSISTAQFPAMICSVFIRRLSKSCCWLNLAVSYFDFVRIIFILSAFATCVLLSSVSSYLVRFQPVAHIHFIGNMNSVSLHSGFIIKDFDKAAVMSCWHYFSYIYVWFGYLVGMTCSRS